MHVSENDIATIISRLDRLEATLSERHYNSITQQAASSAQLKNLEERTRNIEITQARIIVLVTGGSTLGGVIGGTIMLIGKAIGLH